MKTPILLLDNYDSFTYNLYHYLEEVGEREVIVKRNDEISLEEVDAFNDIVLSPGPGLPSESGILIPLIKKYSSTKKILGVCLGMQAMSEAFGGSLTQLHEVLHGIAKNVIVTQPADNLFNEMPSSFMAGRYHSWVVDKTTLPSCLKIIALDDNGQIMGLRHENYNMKGVQFHPESVLTDYGKVLIKNWLNG